MTHPKTALIVGGSSGIGLATARRLQTLGATVHVAGRSPDRLVALADSDPGLVSHRADGNDHHAMATLAREVSPIDWLIITMSGSDGPGPIADLDLGVLRGAFDAKFWGHITTIQTALPHLAPDGSITLLGAITARAGMAGTAGIAAINGAVEALVRPLAVELAPIRVNAVSPGIVDTDWWSAMPEDTRHAYFTQAAQAMPTGRVATADDVAQTVVLGATNPNTTGALINADGGAHLVSMS